MKNSYYKKSLLGRMLTDILVLLLAAAICLGGIVFIIYNGPSKVYRAEFDAQLKAWVQEHFPGVKTDD